ncbi:type II toxin-antitoxin system antitoxin MazE [Staphylococcus saprophyticus]
MASFNQSRIHNIEQLLKEGYSQMADLNLSLAAEAFPFECEACDCNEVYISSKNNNEC